MPKAHFTIPYPSFIERICVWFVLRHREKHYGFAFRLIKLTQGKYAIVDPEDFEKLNAYKWYAVNNHNNTFYAARGAERNNGKRKFVRMHQQIMKPPKGYCVDHENHEGLDNRKINLRIATPAQNSYNRKKISKPSSSKYKGVSWVKRENKWQALIRYKGKRIFLGYFDDEIEAAKAYDEAAKKYYGEFAKLNFGNDSHQDTKARRKNIYLKNFVSPAFARAGFSAFVAN